MKTCPICKQSKPYEAFHVMRKAKDGRHPYCKECASAKMRDAYQLRGKKSWMNDKVCRWCNTLKSRSEFPRLPNGRVGYRCIACIEDIAKNERAGLRRCNICRQWQPETAFYPSQIHRPHIACKECTRAQMTQPEYQIRRRNYQLKKEYGITLDQYKELLCRQNYTCPICKARFEDGDYSNPLDHAHGGKRPGIIRAILHNDCNRFVMWMHEDSAQLRAAADLIDNPLTDWIVPNPTANERRREKERKK